MGERFTRGWRWALTVVSALVLGLVAGTPLSAQAPAPSAPAAPALTRTVQTFRGALIIEGREAPVGTTVSIRAGDRTCATKRSTEAGRYAIDLATPAGATPCVRPGEALRFVVTPSFGSNFSVSAGVLEGDAVFERDLEIDLRALTPDAGNVPWLRHWWPEPRVVPIALCAAVRPEIEAAYNEAVDQWLDAADRFGLLVRLERDDRACDDRVAGIAVSERTLASANALAMALPLDINGDVCGLSEEPCWVHNAKVLMNPRAFGRLSALDKGNVLAHEIGHALGLAHSLRCNGGTLMWADSRCRFPLSSVGVDDIASLNLKVEATLGGATVSAPPPALIPAGSTAAALDEQIARALAAGVTHTHPAPRALSLDESLAYGAE